MKSKSVIEYELCSLEIHSSGSSGVFDDAINFFFQKKKAGTY